jgi:polyisoprenoid-binding protein YceI
MHRRALLLALLPVAALAQTRTLSLSPGNTVIAFSIGALGLFSLEGHFTRFAGALRIDPTLPEATQVAVLVDTGSVEAEGGGTDTARELDLLRTRDYPTLAFRSLSVSLDRDGTAHLQGQLTLAGVTRPLDLTVRREPDRLVAAGILERSAHGLTALRPILSDRVRLSITVRLPGD